MCDVCQNNNIFTVNNANAQYDPTRTTVLRNMFASKIGTKFTKFAREITKAIVELDVLGLKPFVIQEVGRRQFAYPTNERKIEEFMKWIEQLIQRDLLTISTYPQLGSALDHRWTDMYIEDSYKRGVIRARTEMRNGGMSNVQTIEQSGGIQAVMGTPFHIDRVGILFIRSFEELKGITTAMSSQISRVLAEGLMNGDNPRVIARKLNYVITGSGKDLGITDSLGRFIPAKRRAQILARTEIIRAHHRAMIQEYRNWSLAGVYVQAEFRTAGDNRVCSKCEIHHGNFYSLDEAETLIPVHPQCRCIVLPFEVRR